LVYHLRAEGVQTSDRYKGRESSSSSIPEGVKGKAFAKEDPDITRGDAVVPAEVFGVRTETPEKREQPHRPHGKGKREEPVKDQGFPKSERKGATK